MVDLNETNFEPGFAVRKNRRGEIIIGPSFSARVLPFLKYGAPIISVILLPASYLLFKDFAWLSIPLGFSAMYLAVGLLALILTALTNEYWLWNQPQQVLEFKKFLKPKALKRLRTAQITGVEEHFQPQSTSFFLLHKQKISVPLAAWDELSFNALRALIKAVENREVPSRLELLQQDLKFRQKFENQQLAKQYQIPWREEFADPNVFLKAFDEHRKATLSKRK